MEPTVFNVLFEYGSLGVFAVFLVWQYLTMQKRIDSLTEKFLAQLEALQKKYEENEEKLRVRYDAVIEKYQNEKTLLKGDVIAKVDSVGDKFTAISVRMDEIKVVVDSNDILVRDCLLASQRAADILKEIKEEKRIKELARKVHEGDNNRL